MTGREAPVNPENFTLLQQYTVGEVLDIGAGNAHPHADITVDLDPETDPDVVADLTEGIPFDDDSFGTVTAVHVIEHVPDDVGLWTEMQRVASERAISIVPIGDRSDPDHEHLYERPVDVKVRFGWDFSAASNWGGKFDLLFGIDC